MSIHPQLLVLGLMLTGLSLMACQTNTDTVSTASNNASVSPAVVAAEAPAEPLMVANKPSADAVLGLAQHLSSIGAQMYGAYWCPHCQDQKEQFGEAFREIDYVECDPEGENSRTALCIEAGIEGYPTWMINGQKYPGVRSLEELAELSNYDGEGL